MYHETDAIETFGYSAEYEDGQDQGVRRMARQAIAERDAIGRPSVASPAPIILSPFTRRALARQLPAAELVR